MILNSLLASRDAIGGGVPWRRGQSVEQHLQPNKKKKNKNKKKPSLHGGTAVKHKTDYLTRTPPPGCFHGEFISLWRPPFFLLPPLSLFLLQDRLPMPSPGPAPPPHRLPADRSLLSRPTNRAGSRGTCVNRPANDRCPSEAEG